MAARHPGGRLPAQEIANRHDPVPVEVPQLRHDLLAVGVGERHASLVTQQNPPGPLTTSDKHFISPGAPPEAVKVKAGGSPVHAVLCTS